MQPYQERVVDERNELAEKVEKLRIFLSSASFIALRVAEQDRLVRQYQHMTAYLDILNQRILAF
jgi:hypothetical protein